VDHEDTKPHEEREARRHLARHDFFAFFVLLVFAVLRDFAL
jgi:hypothetical protein